MNELCKALVDRIRHSPRDIPYEDGPPTWSVPLPASKRDVEVAEQRLGFRLHETYRDVLLCVGNGGFGPAYGIWGVGDGGAKSEHGDLVDTTKTLMPEWQGVPAVLICEWGGLWSGLDCRSGKMLVVDDIGANILPLSVSDWLGAWVRGESVIDVMVESEVRQMRHWSTGEMVSYCGMGRKKGGPFP